MSALPLKGIGDAWSGMVPQAVDWCWNAGSAEPHGPATKVTVINSWSPAQEESVGWVFSTSQIYTCSGRYTQNSPVRIGHKSVVNYSYVRVMLKGGMERTTTNSLVSF